MRRRIVYRLIPFVLAMRMGVPVSAQSVRGLDLKVEMHGQPETIASGYSLQLIDKDRRFEAARAESDMAGGFALRAVPPGDYVLRITNASGDLVREDFIRLDTNTTVVRVDLPRLPETARPGAGRVSVRQLRNPPSKEAIRAFREAQKHSEAGQIEKAAAALEKAVHVSPDFAEAHTNLGAQYLRLRQYEKAIEQTRLALEAGPPNIHDLGNRGLAEWALGRPEDAIRSAREALRVDARAPAAHYIIGTLLSQNRETRREGIRHLERIAEGMPSAARSLEWARQELAAGGR